MQHLLQDLVQPPALVREPVIERLADLGKAREQRAAMEACRALQRLGRAIGRQPLEPQRIDPDQIGPDRDLAGVGDQAVSGGRRQGLAQAREGLPEVGARVRLGPLVPEQARELLAPLRPGRVQRQPGEQRPDLAGREPNRRTLGRAALEAAEQIEMQKRHPPEPSQSAHAARLSRSCHAGGDARPSEWRHNSLQRRCDVMLTPADHEDAAIERGQVTRSAAEVYEEFFVPALFEEWAPRVAAAAGIRPGHRVLDVACGTGVLAREAARRAAPGGKVEGLDRNPGMLAVARRQAPEIAWREGLAEALPYEAGAFDAVVSQFGLMFFEDRRRALEEMLRVLRPGGRLAVAVWDRLETSPGYAAMTALLQRLFGEDVAAALRAPFVLGDPGELRSLFAAAGMPDVRVVTEGGAARFPSIESWVHTDVKGWTLADLIDDAQYQELLRAAKAELKRFAAVDGTVAFASPAHIVSATKP